MKSDETPMTRPLAITANTPMASKTFVHTPAGRTYVEIKVGQETTTLELTVNLSIKQMYHTINNKQNCLDRNRNCQKIVTQQLDFVCLKLRI